MKRNVSREFANRRYNWWVDLFWPLLTTLSRILPMYLPCCFHPHVEVPLCSRLRTRAQSCACVFSEFCSDKQSAISCLDSVRRQLRTGTQVLSVVGAYTPTPSHTRTGFASVSSGIQSMVRTENAHGETSSNGQAIIRPSDRQVVQRCT